MNDKQCESNINTAATELVSSENIAMARPMVWDDGYSQLDTL